MNKYAELILVKCLHYKSQHVLRIPKIVLCNSPRANQRNSNQMNLRASEELPEEMSMVLVGTNVDTSKFSLVTD